MWRHCRAALKGGFPVHTGSASSGNGAGPQQGEKFRALKAREAAKRASRVAGTAADAIGGVAGTAAVGGLQDRLEVRSNHGSNGVGAVV